VKTKISPEEYREGLQKAKYGEYHGWEMKQVGWLRGEEFPTTHREIKKKIMGNLLYMADHRTVARCFGHHTCDYCGYSSMKYGNGELWLPDHKQEIIWQAPTLIIHYMHHHHFLPPAEYLDCVLNATQEDCDYFFNQQEKSTEWALSVEIERV
jgi:hypothetical protein